MAIPERNMIGVAVMLALLEKFSSLLGTLNFIWATTVLLGGFVTQLGRIDFWCVTAIIVAEGIRIFCRRGELHTGSYYFMIIIKFVSSLILECSAGILLGLVIGFNLYVKHGSSNKARNQNAALIHFYWVFMIESYLVLLGLGLRICGGISPFPWSGSEKSWTRWISRVSEVKEGYKLDDSQIRTLYGFFHNTYSRCVSGSIFDGWKMTIVSYSVELLQSSDGDEQLKGATLLRWLVEENQRVLERLRSIGTIRRVVEMLIDMLNWDPNEFPDQVIRVEAARIIFHLVGISRNRTLVMAAPNSMESIASLLDYGGQVENITQNSYSFFQAGLMILNQLANDHDNRAKMGNNRGLLLKIIKLTELNAPQLHVKIMAIWTLTSIARDQEFRESIGGTDGVLCNFFSLFFENINIDNNDKRALVNRAGEALGFLSLENHHNCEIMMNFPYLIPDLISALNDTVQGTYAARILRNLYAYLEAKSVELEANTVNLNAIRENRFYLNAIRAASEEVVRLAKEKQGLHQEAAIGLAAQIFKFPNPVVFRERGGSIVDFETAGCPPTERISIKGTSKHQGIQHSASDRCYEDGHTSHDWKRITNGFEERSRGSHEYNVGAGELQYLLTTPRVKKSPHVHSIPRTLCHGIA